MRKNRGVITVIIALISVVIVAAGEMNISNRQDGLSGTCENVATNLDISESLNDDETRYMLSAYSMDDENFEIYTLRYGSYEGEKNEKTVLLGLFQDRIVIKSILRDYPDFYIYSEPLAFTEEKGKVLFKDNQYDSQCPYQFRTGRVMTFFYTGNKPFVGTYFDTRDYIEFDYDSERRSLTNATLDFALTKDKITFEIENWENVNLYSHVSFISQSEPSCIPDAPYCDSEYGFMYAERVDTNGDPLPEDKTYRIDVYDVVTPMRETLVYSRRIEWEDKVYSDGSIRTVMSDPFNNCPLRRFGRIAEVSDENSIDNVITDRDDAELNHEVYTITGYKIDSDAALSRPGIYIINGKKVMIK